MTNYETFDPIYVTTNTEIIKPIFTENFMNASIKKIAIKTQSQWKYMVVTFLCIIMAVGQGILLPLFISTFTKTTCNDNIENSSYFILFIMSSLFNLPYVIGCIYSYYKKTLTKEMMIKYWKIFIVLGICVGLNELLTVFSASLNRTNGDLQAILSQITIPSTLIFSRIIINHKITKFKIIATIITMCGIIIAIIPNFFNLNNSNTSLWIYPTMFAIATIPGVLSNVIQHKIFDKDSNYDRSWLLFGDGLFQLITIGLLFWTDFIPIFGTSNNFDQFSEHFKFGFQCFFNLNNVGERCQYCWIIGCAYALCNCMTAYLGAYLIQYGSANYTSMVFAIANPIQIIMWYTITSMTQWSCGSEYTQLQIIMGSIAIPFIIVGAYMYNYYENKQKEINNTLFINSEQHPYI